MHVPRRCAQWPGLIDLSHTIHDGLITFKGLPGPRICDYLSREASRKNYEGGTEFQIGRIEMVTNTGTYIDCPFHRYADGKDMSETALERFVNLPAIVVRVQSSCAHRGSRERLRRRRCGRQSRARATQAGASTGTRPSTTRITRS